MSAGRARLEHACSLVAEGAWIVLGQTLIVVAGVVSVPILTGRLEPAIYGQLALALTINQLFNQVVVGGVTQSLARYFPVAAERGDIAAFLAAMYRMLAGATACLPVLGGAAAAVACVNAGDGVAGLVLATSLYATLAAWNTAMNGVHNAARRRRTVAVNQCADSWLRLALAVVAMELTDGNAVAVLLGYTVSSGFVLVSQLMALRRTAASADARYSRDRKTRTETAWTKTMWCFAWPVSAWGIFSWLQQSSDKWSLAALGTQEDVGHYAVLYQLGYGPMNIFGNLMLTFLAPVLFARSGDGSNKRRGADAAKALWWVALLCLVSTTLAFVVLQLVGDDVFHHVVAERYWSIASLLPWMALAGGLFATGQVLSLKPMSDGSSKRLLVPKIVTGCIGFAMNAAGAALAGIEGVVFAVVSFAVVYTLWMAVIAARGPERPLEI